IRACHVTGVQTCALPISSGMTNLPAFLALTRDRLAGVPVVLFFHENQLTYPLREGRPRDLTYAYVNYLSALAADRVVFNSAFHRSDERRVGTVSVALRIA